MLHSRLASPFEQSQEFGFGYDLDFKTLLNHGLGLSVFGAFFMSGQQVQILIADNKNGGFSGDASLDFHASFGGKSGGVFAAHGNFTREASDCPKEFTVDVGGFTHGFWVGLAGFWFGQFFDGLISFFHSGQNNHCGGFGILFGVVVGEFEVQPFFKVCQAMSAIANEFRPSAAGDDDTVVPLHVGKGHCVGVKSGLEGAFVKLAVLDDFMRGHQAEIGLDNAAEWRCAGDHFSGDAVNADVKIIKIAERINQILIGLDSSIVLNASNTDLTDAASVRICGFDIKRNKAVGAMKWASCGINHLIFKRIVDRRVRGNNLSARCGRGNPRCVGCIPQQPFQKPHRINPFGKNNVSYFKLPKVALILNNKSNVANIEEAS